MRAVLLAAGEGRRLRPYFNRPKPLIRLLGLTLIERNILSLRECGIDDFVIILGYHADEIKDYLGSGEKLGVRIKYLYNPDWPLGNGVSTYTFHQDYREDEKYILMMCDHIFSLDLLKDFIAEAENIKPDELLLAADRDLEQIFDLKECTKVYAEGNSALKLGKVLDKFNAVDCGLFLATGSLLKALAESISIGGYALTDGVNLMAGQGKVKLHYINNWWMDVDDYPSYKQAENILLQSLIPPKDGLISRLVNRRVSLRITKILAPTRITPNQITVFSFLTALAAATSFALASPIIGGLLAQLSSILDGVDGEISRLKFLQSKFGEVWDSILDRYGDFFLIIGMGYAWYYPAGEFMALVATAVALAGVPMSMLFKEKYRNVYGRPFISEEHDCVIGYLATNRDGRLFIIMLGGLFNIVPATLIFLAVITHLQTFYRLYKVRRINLA